jgi:GNAT superfamily N-acetyltransferase
VVPLIRPVARTDSPGVAALLGELGYPCDASEAELRIDRDCADGGSGTLVAADNDSLLGLISYERMYYFPSNSTLCRITALVVSSEARRHGVARCLVDAVVTMAASRGCSMVEVTTSTARDDAHSFYEDCGFHRTSYRYLKEISPPGP